MFRHVSYFVKFGKQLCTFYVKVRIPPSYIVSRTVLSKTFVSFCHRDKYLAKCARVAPKIAWRFLMSSAPVFLSLVNQNCNLLANFGKTFQYNFKFMAPCVLSLY